MSWPPRPRDTRQTRPRSPVAAARPGWPGSTRAKRRTPRQPAPTRRVRGFRNTFLTITGGTGIMGSLLLGYRPWAGDFREQRNGAMTASSPGNVLAFGLANAQERGFTFIEPGEQVYEGMIVGIQKRPGDMSVNVCKEKKQTNMRSSNADIMVRLTPATKMSLEQCLDFLADDELLEVTPKHIRLRKRHLTEVDRARAHRAAQV